MAADKKMTLGEAAGIVSKLSAQFGAFRRLDEALTLALSVEQQENRAQAKITKLEGATKKAETEHSETLKKLQFAQLDAEADHKKVMALKKEAVDKVNIQAAIQQKAYDDKMASNRASLKELTEAADIQCENLRKDIVVLEAKRDKIKASMDSMRQKAKDIQANLAV